MNSVSFQVLLQLCIVESGMDRYVAVYISSLITTNNRELSCLLNLSFYFIYTFQDVAVKVYTGSQYDETLLDYKKEVHLQYTS